MSAEAAADLAAGLDLGSRITLEAALAAFLLVTSLFGLRATKITPFRSLSMAGIGAVVAAVDLGEVLARLRDGGSARAEIPEIDAVLGGRHEGATLLMHLMISVGLRVPVHVVSRHDGSTSICRVERYKMDQATLGDTLSCVDCRPPEGKSRIKNPHAEGVAGMFRGSGGSTAACPQQP